MGSDRTHDSRWDAAEEIAELIRDGDGDRAIVLAEAVIASDPKNEYAFYFLGCAHFERADFELALAAFTKALELSPEYVGAMSHAAQTLRLLGRYAEAIRIGRVLLRRKPNDPDSLFLLGACHASIGDAAAARDYLNRFLATGPEVEVQLEVEGILKGLETNVVSIERAKLSRGAKDKVN